MNCKKKIFQKRIGERTVNGLPKWLVYVVGTLIVFCSLSLAGFAQSSSTLTGHVRDEQGASLAGAEVRLRSRGGLRLFARTNAEGIYGFTGLGAGDYIVEVKARGFASLTSDELHVERGQTLTSDLVLPVEALSEKVVVVATGTPQRAEEVSKAVTLIDDQEIEAKRELSLPEALRGTPGLRVQQQGSYGALTTLRLRGQRNFDTAILLDGLRVRDASDINGSAVSMIPDLSPVDLDRVEILRGSGSSIYGTNAIGGVINLVPKTGAGAPRFEAGFEGGSLGVFRERLLSSGGIGERAGYSVGLTRFDVRRGVDGQDEYGNTAGAARFQFDATPSINIAANFYGTVANARQNSSPFALAAPNTTNELYPRAEAGVNFQPDFNNPDQGRRLRSLVGSVRFTQRVGEMFSYTVAYQHVATDRRNYNGEVVDPRYAAFTPFGDFAYNSLNNGTTDTLDARANLRLSRSHLITAGIEFEREKFFQRFLSSFGAGDGTTDRQRTFAVFGQDQLFFFNERLQISAGVRGQFFRVRATDRPGALSNITPQSSVTGDGALAYFFRSTGTKLRAHVGNGFRAPSLYERFGEGTFANAGFVRFGDPTLRAEQSIGVDGGFDQRLASDRVRFGATYFYTRLQRIIDFTSFVADPLGAGRFFGYTNRRGGISRGLETYLEAAPLRGMDVRASYTFTNSDRVDPLTGLQREFVIPTHQFGVTVNQRYRAFLFNVDLNHTGSYVGRLFYTFPLVGSADLLFPGYTKADAFVSYERSLNERVTMVLFGGGDNLFNVRYYENGFRAPGATGRGGVNFRF
jgi:iron complex outermembrane receptor protein